MLGNSLVLADQEGAGAPQRPVGFLSAPTEELRSINELLESEDSNEALIRLIEMSPDSSLENRWVNYFKGVALLNSEKYEEGLAELELPCLYVRENASLDLTKEDFRLAGMCLKKIGWYHRRQENYHLAYAHHSVRHQYMQGYGSHAEMADAAISLDVDCYYLKDLRLSEMWLHKATMSAEGIVNPTLKERFMGMSFNNLSGTLRDMKRFVEAVALAKESEKRWSSYERFVGKAENRAVWAKYTIGDVYQSWAETLKESGSTAEAEYAEKRNLALAAYRAGFEMGQKNGMAESDLAEFTQRIVLIEDW